MGLERIANGFLSQSLTDHFDYHFRLVDPVLWWILLIIAKTPVWLVLVTQTAYVTPLGFQTIACGTPIKRHEKRTQCFHFNKMLLHI